MRSRHCFTALSALGLLESLAVGSLVVGLLGCSTASDDNPNTSNTQVGDSTAGTNLGGSGATTDGDSAAPGSTASDGMGPDSTGDTANSGVTGSGTGGASTGAASVGGAQSGASGSTGVAAGTGGAMGAQVAAGGMGQTASGGSSTDGTGGVATGGGTGGGAAAGGYGGGAPGGAGASGMTGGAGGSGGAGLTADDFFGIEEGDTIPHRKLNFTWDGGESLTQFRPSDANPAAAGGAEGTNEPQWGIVSSCAPKMLGKLMVDLGVNIGQRWLWAAERGFHYFAVDFYWCRNIDGFRDRDYPGDCRLETFDGQDHDDEMAVDLAHSITGHLQDGLRYLHEQQPEQDWEYFLNEDGTVRWSDVAFTGYSHGAQSAARFAKVVRLYRAVSRSGPRDSQCGRNGSNPPYDPNCPLERIASWLDEESATPVERMFGIIGTSDSQYGDIMFSMERMGYPGEPVDITSAEPPLDSNRFFMPGGHNDIQLQTGERWVANYFNHAFGVPEENRNGCN